MSSKSAAKPKRVVALCYIRQSFTRAGEPEDLNSPERQRANIQAACEKHGWTPEWYEDVGGHRSGRSEKNRPQWLALKARLGDPDVAALVANDLSRLHRKGWRVGDLIEFLGSHEIDLVLAAPGRDVDTSTMKGRMFLQFGAIIDEFYAEDISQRAKDSIQYRKSLGKSVGMPPFGTARNAEGYLIPSPEGAWLMADGTFLAGRQDNPPEGAVSWRGYYDTARRILTLYASGRLGQDRVAYAVNDEGWPYRDRNGTPRMVWRDDIRRVIANWPEYGGLLNGKRGKDRPPYEAIDADEIAFNEERAVFDIDLLRQVARMRQERSRGPRDVGITTQSYPYPLSAISFCAHCERMAVAQKNPRLRSHLTGKGAHRKSRDTPRYRHKPGATCGCQSRSVPAEKYEGDFYRLIQLLSIRPEALDLMTELAIQADQKRFAQDVDIEKKKEEAMALCRRRIDAAVNLYKDGEIDRAEYLHIREANEREIAHWQKRSTETEQLAIELAMCVQAVDHIARLWEVSDDEDRRGLAQSLFDSIVYDLDAQRIVSFQLKPWADRFLGVRAGLYAQDNKNPALSRPGNEVPPWGFEPQFQP